LPRVTHDLGNHTGEALLGNPALGRPGRVLGTRERVIGGLPYTVPFRMREKDIEILRVLHTSRRWSTDFGER
jgi:plasmid stabilization system protein ParE